MEYSQQSATIIFTASTVMVVISLMLITSAWRSLKDIMRTLPPNQRRIYPFLRVGQIKDKVARDREIHKNCLWTGALLLGINIFINVASLISIAGLFVGLNFGFQETAMENFNGARYMLFVSPSLLMVAILLIGGYRLKEFMAMKAGRIDPERWSEANKTERKPARRVKRTSK